MIQFIVVSLHGARLICECTFFFFFWTKLILLWCRNETLSSSALCSAGNINWVSSDFSNAKKFLDFKLAVSQEEEVGDL